MKAYLNQNRCAKCGATALRQEKGVCVWFKGKRLMAGCTAIVASSHDGTSNVLHLCALCSAEEGARR